MIQTNDPGVQPEKTRRLFLCTVTAILLVSCCWFTWRKWKQPPPAESTSMLFDSATCAHICAINEREQGKDTRYIWADSAEIARSCPCFVDQMGWRLDDTLQSNAGRIPSDDSFDVRVPFPFIVTDGDSFHTCNITRAIYEPGDTFVISMLELDTSIRWIGDSCGGETTDQMLARWKRDWLGPYVNSMGQWIKVIGGDSFNENRISFEPKDRKGRYDTINENQTTTGDAVDRYLSEPSFFGKGFRGDPLGFPDSAGIRQIIKGDYALVFGNGSLGYTTISGVWKYIEAYDVDIWDSSRECAYLKKDSGWRIIDTPAMIRVVRQIWLHLPKPWKDSLPYGIDIQSGPSSYEGRDPWGPKRRERQ